MLLRMFYDDKLAQASYFIGCQAVGEALVIDPERDVDKYIEFARREGMRIVAVTETHIHADYLSGSRELAEKTGARVYLSDEGDADWKYQWIDKKQGGGSYDAVLLKDGDTFRVGNIEIKALHTPGHTPEHMCFMVTDHGGGATEPMGVATGDFIFVGDVGRPDLLETAAGVAGAKEVSARVLYRSLQKFKEWPEYLQIWPGHGAGSACGKALGAVPQSTVGYEKRFNPSVRAAEDEERFVRFVLFGQPEPPLYFARMKRDNKVGPPILGEIPRPKALDVDGLKAIAGSDAAIIDLRGWQKFVAGHLPGAIFSTVSNALPNTAGSYIMPEEEIYLIGTEEEVREATLVLIRIGLDKVVGYATPETFEQYVAAGGPVETTKVKPMTALLDNPAPSDAYVLDVRNISEFQEGHLPEAINVAYTRLIPRLSEIPKDKPLLVHCRTDNRSAAAVSYLQKLGYDVTHLSGGIVAWQMAGGVVEKDKTLLEV